MVLLPDDDYYNRMQCPPSGHGSRGGGSGGNSSTSTAGHPRPREYALFVQAQRRLNDMLTVDEGTSTASYTPRMCRSTFPGQGGAPLSNGRPPSYRAPPRPSSAPSQRTFANHGRPPTKTERWREAGETRWPEPGSSDGPLRTEETLPFRRTVPNAQLYYGNTLWVGSLRAKETALKDPMNLNDGGNIKELVEEWRPAVPYMHVPYSGSIGQVPYSGATASGKVALKNAKDPRRWVGRPVATGKYALDHMEGTRYKWKREPRHCVHDLPPEQDDAAAAMRLAESMLEREAEGVVGSTGLLDRTHFVATPRTSSRSSQYMSYSH
eukprot:TRINITY_DN57099_c0_g1_i1.p1 TRINITY_DN57099_c0_g1~~TRINITY_DN57099_c0_g1_i1.p1  ORF type:complete len:356 (-),score=32.98 TRINITY_DN57099_c0_g1_i1:96-1064(-)